MFKIFKYDYYRNTGLEFKFSFKSIKNIIGMHGLRYILCLRLLSGNKGITFKIINLYRFFLGRKYGIEILPETKIGKGFRMGHPYNITISPYAIIGDNVNVNKGVTIGMSPGKNGTGAPVIGNMVQVGINSSVIGKIKIGNDVVIAPNSMVNIDVPDHSVVIGNPCIIKHKLGASEKLVNFCV